MLVLSRKTDEKIIVKRENMPDIVITIVRIDQNRVKIGIDADQDITILREELTSIRR